MMLWDITSKRYFERIEVVFTNEQFEECLAWLKSKGYYIISEQSLPDGKYKFYAERETAV
jgi:hypothetical protein